MKRLLPALLGMALYAVIPPAAAKPAILYHEKILTIIWDKTGEKYGKGKGLTLFIDGKQAAQAETLTKITASLQ